MNKESKVIAKRTWDAKQIGDVLLNNALFILMAIAIIYIAISNPRFIQPASIINIISQTAATCLRRWALRAPSCSPVPTFRPGALSA